MVEAQMRTWISEGTPEKMIEAGYRGLLITLPCSFNLSVNAHVCDSRAHA